jgi:hypothetical protein
MNWKLTGCITRNDWWHEYFGAFYMSEDKKINTRDLPKQWERTTTQQPEEYIDKQSVRKDENEKPEGPAEDAADVRRQSGSQETE